MAAIKRFRPRSNSLSTGQVLPRAYTVAEGEVILREMVEELGLELTRRGLVARSVVVEVKLAERGRGLAGNEQGAKSERGHSSERLDEATAEVGRLERAALAAYRRAAQGGTGLKRLTVTLAEVTAPGKGQLSLFGRGDGGVTGVKRREGVRGAVGVMGAGRGEDLQRAVLKIKRRYGKNAILRGISFEEGATARAPPRQRRRPRTGWT